jgi:hypothetical protein
MMKERVLLIMPKFHEYPLFIQQGFLSLGYDVDIFFDLSANSIYQKFKNSDRALFKLYLQRFKSSILKSVINVEYNKVLVIKGSGLDSSFYRQLKDIQKDAIFYMYQWDSLTNFDYLQVVSLFDKISTFDRSDFEKNLDKKFNYVPLFFVKSEKYNSNKEYDISFVGGVTLERYKWLNKLESLLIKNKLRFYFYRYISLAQYLHLLSKGILLNPFKLKFNSLSYHQMAALFNKSKSVVDIAHGSQTGLTMRTFDALANSCKIISNNAFIMKEEFYNKSNILIVSLDEEPNIECINSFLIGPFEEINDFNDYSVREWANKVLS